MLENCRAIDVEDSVFDPDGLARVFEILAPSQSGGGQMKLKS
ncbi:hypothetical protein RD1_0701 [Roseobacter denitrificans OCh 114]|uniref:Uncharacterized protein n=1 Tax=Roseobacter denitrificans (strain ATCC 33942 / OCh 114) TaxID=375451 RepID=Q16C96_ROSDO|nr:hypothetical protein RD1_0701 [Roseobacter denitrificans OCh 114]